MLCDTIYIYEVNICYGYDQELSQTVDILPKCISKSFSDRTITERQRFYHKKNAASVAGFSNTMANFSDSKYIYLCSNDWIDLGTFEHVYIHY